MSIANPSDRRTNYSSESTTSSDEEVWTVTIPAVDYMRQAFFGALARLGDSDYYDPVSDQAALYGSKMLESLYQISLPEVIGVEGLQTHVTLWHIFAIVEVAGPITKSIRTAHVFNHAGFQSPSGGGDKWMHPVWLRAGTYDFSMMYVKTNTSGIVEITISGPGTSRVTGALDFYNATTLENQHYHTTFNFDKSGLWTVRGLCTNKNASSSAHNLIITCIDLFRTGD